MKKTILILFLLNTFFIGSAETEEMPEMASMMVLSHGRPLPFISFAERSLYQISGRNQFQGLPAHQWLSKLIFNPGETIKDPVFLIENPEVLFLFGLNQEKRGRYSYADLRPGFTKFFEAANTIKNKPDVHQQGIEKEILHIAENISYYLEIGATMDFLRPISPESNVTYLKALKNLSVSNINQELQNAAYEIMVNMEDQYKNNPIRFIPVNTDEGLQWKNPFEIFKYQSSNKDLSDFLDQLAKAQSAYRQNDMKKFNLILSAINLKVENKTGKDIAFRNSMETFQKKINFFLWAQLAYFIGLLFYLTNFLKFDFFKQISKIAFIFLLAGFLLHLTEIILRMIATRRPPVTDLYSTYLFVSLLLAFSGIVLIIVKQKRLGYPLGLIGGLLIAYLSQLYIYEGDSMGVMAAVLNSNFWLSTHVLTIIAGYTGTLAAGITAHFYLISIMLKPENKKNHHNIYKALYGFLWIGLIFTFIGTMLGGIWADQSWGRFWGWDPKENGALLIILWIAIIMHGKRAKMFSHRGVALSSVFATVVVFFSWLGVNLLGVGLHSYGFTSDGAIALILFTLFELIFIGISLMVTEIRKRN